MGAIASGGIPVPNEDLLRYLEILPTEIEAVAAREQKGRERLYRGGRPMAEVRDRIVILVDDGIATGTTMRSAVPALKQQQPARMIIAVPTAAQSSCDEYQADADRIQCVCLMTPEPFFAVGLWYENFSQTSDDEVRDLLASFASNQFKLLELPWRMISTYRMRAHPIPSSRIRRFLTMRVSRPRPPIWSLKPASVISTVLPMRSVM